MLRKKQEKSNMLPIGIFQGKQAEYNKLILKTLFENGKMTAWQIAKYICQAKHTFKNNEKDVIYSRSQRIYSVIQRKNGRLNELENKGYIKATPEGAWELTFKSIIALLLLDPDLIKKAHPDYNPNVYFPKIFKQLENMNFKGMPTAPFGVKVDKAAIKNFIQALRPLLTQPNIHENLIKAARKLIDEGIDLDRIAYEKFIMLLATQHIQQTQFKLMNSTFRF